MVQIRTKITVYKISTVDADYRSKAWTICKRTESRITAAEIKLLRRTADYTRLDYKNNINMMN